MEEQKRKRGQSITIKTLIIAALTLLMLIPNAMVQNLISERQQRSQETIAKINDKWSRKQTICGPILIIPTTQLHYQNGKKNEETFHYVNIVPEMLKIDVALSPEKRHFGIYETIVYKSRIVLSGNFSHLKNEYGSNYVIHWDEAFIALGISDLRGLADELNFEFDNQCFRVKSSENDGVLGKKLMIPLNGDVSFREEDSLAFYCQFNLNGSEGMSFIPVGKTTRVNVAGVWESPGFTGNFSPEYTIDSDAFQATWGVLHFNRNIPDYWIDNYVSSFYESSFGVDLVAPVDHYQQNMRSSKYAFMFIALTFVVFFFVEIITKKRIHPIQYFLVGVALILFYSLLLSLSEQIAFGWAYLIAGVATIGLIGVYAYSIFKSKLQTGIMTSLLALLYGFLYMTLQLEDVALLVGSIGLFVILGIIMYVSRKINWYKEGVD